MSWLQGLLLVVLFLGLTLAPVFGGEQGGAGAGGDEEIEFDTEAIEDFVNENLPAGFEAPTPEEWSRFWQQLDALLGAQSLEDLAAFKPVADLALKYLAAIPDSRGSADWLQQRLDYFDVADSAVRDVPVVPVPAVPDDRRTPTPPFPRAPEATLPPLVVPAVPPVREAVPAPIEQTRSSTIRSGNVWVKKLAKRPLPASAGTLIPRLKAVFKQEGVPPELVWIAEVESTLNPDAESSAGAAGLFQLMPRTANRFGLRTFFFDERKDPEKSARAAARYLKALYRQMGSWELALASYNAGEGRVGRLKKERKATSFNEIAEHLPVETQMYVPKVMALITLRENIDPAKLPPPRAG
ncbi:MAG: hypothetical protein A3K19_26905 [Lentisphaerae bacterium RIFOXYB12_FULL_65_16]|nr:MAG: hypothetical protein A3K18_23880 [Lentisphaerae bacterium RIFOXYA12_64_32]OGV88029.1 MAG: hypothetical protein A3K19_26905 [Lentisphaerae bacterium RIFOXYB12_FULL_65_16]